MIAVEVINNDTAQHALLAIISTLLVTLAGVMVWYIKRSADRQAKETDASTAERERWAERLTTYMAETNTTLRERVHELVEAIAKGVEENGALMRQHEEGSLERHRQLLDLINRYRRASSASIRRRTRPEPEEDEAE